jgi:PKD repeat protein
VWLKDANNCVTSKTIPVTEPPALVLTETHVDVLCNGASTGSIDLTVSGGTPGYSYSWSPGGATTQDLSSLAAGTYTVTVTDANSCTATKPVTITEPPVLTASFTANSPVCFCTYIDFDGSASGGTPPYSYSWDFGDGVGTSSDEDPSYHYTAAGTYTVTLTVTDSNGCTDDFTDTVTVYALPTATITPDTGYGGVDLEIHGNPSGGSGTYTTHSWTGDTTYLSATDIENPILNAPAGTYDLTYTVTDSNGCVGSDTITGRIRPSPPVAEDQSLTTCMNEPLTITLTATDPEIDPENPDLHPLTFTIWGPAEHGTVSGNLGAVTYEEPHIASVEVLYTPAQDFLGEDSFTFLVEDPFGDFSIGTVRITVEECEEEVAGAGGAAILASVVINEVAWGGTEANPQDEWIELLNNTDESVDLSGWTLRWKRKQPATPEEETWKTVELSGEIAPNGFYLLERRQDETVIDLDASLIYDTVPPYPLELSDLGEVMELLDADGAVVDTANADHPERDGWVAGAGAEGLPAFGTMERIDPLSPDLDDNWATNRHIIINGRDALTDLLTATAVMINENTLIRGLEDETPQIVQLGQEITVTIAIPEGVEVGEGLPQVILARVDAAVGGGGAALEPEDQAAALSSGRVEGLPSYEVTLETSELALGTYRLWINMGNGVFHHLLIEVVEE